MLNRILDVFGRFPESDLRSDKFIKGLYRESGIDYPPSQHRLGWSTKKLHLDFLHHMVLALKPKYIVETGTFEGHGTYAIAAAAHKNNNGAKIFTVDYDGDPLQDVSGAVSMEEWIALREIRAANIATVQASFSQCSVEFIDGDSRKVLPQVLERIPQWDFWYQDSMHYYEGIREEWEIMESKAAGNASVIFDDIWKRNGFSNYFRQKYAGNWSYVPRRDFGHKQCLAQRLK